MSEAFAVEPTNGRIVWFVPGADFPGTSYHREKGLAAIICHVWNTRIVNLDVIDSRGVHWPMRSVDLVQPGDVRNPDSGISFCTWMPYQLGQAQKTEAAQAELAKHVAEMDDANQVPPDTAKSSA